MKTKRELPVVEMWLRALSSALKVDIVLDEEDICTLQIGEERIVIEATDKKMVNIYCHLLSLPETDGELTMFFMMRALEFNASEKLLRGGVIAASPGSYFLIYRKSIPIQGTDSVKFCQLFDLMLETVQDLRKMMFE